MIGKIVKITLDDEEEKKVKGLVYKVNIGKKFYIGSTKMKLNQRQHKHNYRIRNGSKSKFHQEAIKNNIFKVKCEEIYSGEDYLEVENKMILESIEDKNCLNMRVVKTTAERRKEQKSRKGECPLCGLVLMKKNRARHLRNKHNVTKFDFLCKKVNA